MKPFLAMFLLLSAMPAIGEEASCTYTFNQTSRKIVRVCRGNAPVPPLASVHQVGLTTGKLKSCVVKAEFNPSTKSGQTFPAVCS